MNKQATEDHAAFQQQIAEAVDAALIDERAAISKELHDNVNQELALALMYIGAAEKQIVDNIEWLKKSKEIITKAIHCIRQLSHELSPKNDGAFLLVEKINQLVEKIQFVHPINIEFNASEFDENNLPETVKLNLFRIIQELVHNTLKHAQANHLTIQLRSYQQRISLLVSDDGIGFDASAVPAGIGLANIADRVKIMGGEMHIVSNIGAGCETNINCKPIL